MEGYPMNLFIKTLQKDLGFLGDEIDGIRGPKTNGAILAAADAGNLSVVTPVVGPVVLASQEPPWITAIKVAFGWHEIRDKAKLSSWLRSDGKTLGDPTQKPWCGDAMETAMKNAGFTLDLKVAENPYWARNWLFFGRSTSPCLWAIGVFERDGGFGHVGFLVGQDSDEYYVLGGNQGDAVNITRLAKTRLLGARLPIGYEMKITSLPQMSAGSVPRSVNEF